ncbi:hypothetical protein MMC17_002852 [Xylographa soralifera]|nr:hypothetical protein [Xylographa soralifera]
MSSNQVKEGETVGIDLGSPSTGSPSTIFRKDTRESTSYDCEAATCTLVSNKWSWRTWLSAQGREESPGSEDLIIRHLESCPEGYPRLAAFLSSEYSFSIYRSFGYLHSRVLLGLQDQIVALERELDQKDTLDLANGWQPHLRSRARDERESDRDGDTRARAKILDDIRRKLGEYGAYFHGTLAILATYLYSADGFLVKARDLVSFQKPSKRDYNSVLNWIWNHKPLVDKEQCFIKHEEDVLTLHNGREWCGFDELVESLLLKLDCNFVRWMFLAPEVRNKTLDRNVHYYTRSRVNRLIGLVITSIIFVLLVLPVIAMYKLTAVGAKPQSTFNAVGVLVVFTLLFSAAMSLLTKAQRHELFAASAAYCAVLYEENDATDAYSPDIGLGATLSQLGNPDQADDLHTTNSGLKDDGDSGYLLEDWKVVGSHPKRRKSRQSTKSTKVFKDQAASERETNRPGLTFAELHKLHSSLRILDLQGLVLYCLADGVSPQWISVRHHAQVRKAVVLLVPGIERDMFDETIKLLDPASRIGKDQALPAKSTADESKVQQCSTNELQKEPLPSPRRSPDDYLPFPLVFDHLSAPLKPLAKIFSHFLPVNAPGDDKYYKVHSPLQAMLTSPIPKSQEDRNAEKLIKGPRPPRENSSWSNERTPITSFIASNEDLQENEYAMHPACFDSDQGREDSLIRRRFAKQLREFGWVDTKAKVLEDVEISESQRDNGGLTAGRTVFALDCEMCQVEGDEYALTRISIIGWNGEVIMDELVMPNKPITNYLTQYSGMTAAKLASVTTMLPDIQARLLDLFVANTILIGHSLNADLNAMKLTHPFIIDTSILYPHPRGPPLKSSLKFLAQKYLRREIQQNHGSTGHDSIEDATACLDLVKQKCEKGVKWGTSEASGESIFTRISRMHRPGTAKEADVYRLGARVDHGRKDQKTRGPEKFWIPCSNDEEVVGGVKRAVLGDNDGAVVPGGGVDFTWARLRELENLRGWSNDNRNPVSPYTPTPEPSLAELSLAVSQTVQNIVSIHAILPPCTLFIVYSGTGDPKEMGRLQEMQRRFKREYAIKKWDELSVRWTDVEEQALRRACAMARQGAGFCLRRAAVRALTTSYTSISVKPRSITTLSASTLRKRYPSYISAFQKRFASEDVTQAEPEADGATEAQHGKNSIASATEPDQSATTSSEQLIQPVDQEDQSTIASALSSSTEAVSNTASSAAEAAATSTQTVRDYAADAASAVGVGAATAQAIAGRSSGEGAAQAHTLYVGNLFFDVTEDTLKREFQKYGDVNMVRVIYDGRGLSKGFGYVEFADSSSAAQAIENLNQQIFEGRRMTVQYTIRKDRPQARSGAFATKNPPSKTLFIGNMSFEMSDKDLNDLFRDIKNVIDVRVAIDRRTGQPRGFAHADFIDVGSAEKARQILESKEIYGRRLRVDFSASSTQTRGPRDSTNP